MAMRQIQAWAVLVGLGGQPALAQGTDTYMAPEGPAVMAGQPGPVAPVTLETPAAVRPGADFTLRWSGPGAAGDWIDLVDPGTAGLADNGDYTTYSYALVAESREGGLAELTAPDVPGPYEIRYVGETSAEGRAILQRQPITVSADVPETGADDGTEAAQDMTEEADSLSEDIGYLCQDAQGCRFEDDETGVGFTLPEGWATDYPYRDGPESPVRINFFDTGSAAVVVLNRPEELTKGLACLQTRLGRLCDLSPPDAPVEAVMAELVRSLRLLDANE